MGRPLTSRLLDPERKLRDWPVVESSLSQGSQADEETSRLHRQPSLSCILPCRNESENLDRLLPRLLAVLAGLVDAWEVIVVDDGLATGATMEAAVRALQQLAARTIVVAVPVGAPEAVERIRQCADQVVCLRSPATFGSVGACYASFDQTSDAEVSALLTAARIRRAGPGTQSA